jgi:hypothetical protein
MPKGKSKTRGSRGRSSPPPPTPSPASKDDGWTAGLLRAIVVGVASGLGTGFVQVPFTAITSAPAEATERSVPPAEPRSAAPPLHEFLVELKGSAGSFQKRVRFSTGNPYNLWMRAAGDRIPDEYLSGADYVKFEVSSAPDGPMLAGSVERERLIQHIRQSFRLTEDQERLVKQVTQLRLSAIKK